MVDETEAVKDGVIHPRSRGPCGGRGRSPRQVSSVQGWLWLKWGTESFAFISVQSEGSWLVMGWRCVTFPPPHWGIPAGWGLLTEVQWVAVAEQAARAGWRSSAVLGTTVPGPSWVFPGLDTGSRGS